MEIKKEHKIRDKKDDDKYLEEDLKELSKYILIFSNKDRRKILDLCFEKPKTITELKNILKSSNKVTWHNVMSLKEIDLVDLEKRENESGRPVYVKSLFNSADTLQIIRNFLNDTMSDLKK